jgi:malate dehydrogenase (oxaloacetate-decarboxylating)
LAISAPVKQAVGPLRTRLRGRELLSDRMLNKDSAFTELEREVFALNGLLPPRVLTIEQQERLELEHVRRKADDLERYIGLAALQDRNETLFHRVLRGNLEELLPIVYTPTVGRACQEFSHILRRPHGLWLTPMHAGRMAELLRNAALPDVRLIVATDNERILGLGDQGAGGMGIPVGKLAIYGAVAGIHPAQTLPISLDVGTDHQGLLEDPLYIGHRAPRLRGAAYDDFVDEFVEAVREVLPRAVLQWEDFKGANALRLLARYRRRLPSFNDDIQGTGATAVAGLLAAGRLLSTDLAGQRFLLVGAGAAGIGIARVLKAELLAGGMSEADFGRRLALVDHEGLVHSGREASREKAEFSVDAGLLPSELTAPRPAVSYDLAQIIAAWRPTVLIGTTGTAGSFDEAAIRTLAAAVDRPIIMALSNPTSACEAPPDRLLAWSDGHAIVSTGSPFRPIELDGVERLVGQANNALIFPGLGLGAIVSEAVEVTDGMLLAAARTLAGLVSRDRLEAGSLYPPVADMPALAKAVARAVIVEARDSGLGRSIPDGGIDAAIEQARWLPEYRAYVP